MNIHLDNNELTIMTNVPIWPLSNIIIMIQSPLSSCHRLILLSYFTQRWRHPAQGRQTHWRDWEEAKRGRTRLSLIIIIMICEDDYHCGKLISKHLKDRSGLSIRNVTLFELQSKLVLPHTHSGPTCTKVKRPKGPRRAQWLQRWECAVQCSAVTRSQ